MNFFLLFTLILGFSGTLNNNFTSAHIKPEALNKVSSLKTYSQTIEKRPRSYHKSLSELFNPPGDGAPTDTTAGGSRKGDSCLPNEPAIVALMPQANYGLTLHESPQIYLYLAQSSAQEVLITLQDEAGDIYETNFVSLEADRNAGVTAFSLPDAAMPLKSDRRYQWFITVVCNDFVQPNDPTFSGWIRRIENTPETERQLAQQERFHQAQWYAQNGYWYDMLRAIPQDSMLWQEIIENAK